MKETLRQKQSRFSLGVALLIQQADRLGYFVSLGEAYRTPEQAKLNAAKGTGIANSLHCDRLAIDLNLFDRSGKFLTDGTGHKELSKWWKQLSPDHRWGGDTKKLDFNHYALDPGDGRI